MVCIYKRIDKKFHSIVFLWYLYSTGYQLRNFYPSIAEYTTILESNGFIVTYAQLIERPTHLDDPNGLQDWIKIFRTNILEQFGDKGGYFLNEVQNRAKDKLFVNGKWYADYVRLRIVAYKS